MTASPDPPAGPPLRPARRDALSLITTGVVGAGVLAATWPFIAQWAPNPATPEPDTLMVDLADIKVGQTIKVAWRGRPYLIRRRSNAEILRTRFGQVERLRDGLARNPAVAAQAPATAHNRTLPLGENWLLVSAVCPHDGCVIAEAPPSDLLEQGILLWCPCDASRFDSLGRVLSGPAQTNLAVPPAALLIGEKLRIG